MFAQFLGAGARNGADVGHNFIVAHANTSVADGQGVLFPVGLEPDFKFMVRRKQFGLGQRFKSEPVKSVRSVGDQFPQKDFSFRIKRMDHQVEKLFGFRLKLVGLDSSSAHNHPSSKNDVNL